MAPQSLDRNTKSGIPVLFIKQTMLESLENRLNQIRSVATGSGETITYHLNMWWNAGV